jgi:enterochelin esterase-like enzyme
VPTHNYDRPQGRVVEIEIESAHLGNMLGDPTTRTVAVYLPPGYDEADTHYPLLVDLAGFTGSGLKRLSWTAYGESVPQRIDRLVADGEMGPVVAAFPDAFTRLGGNQYVDSIAMGRWERYLLDDVVPTLSSSFRILPGARHRAVYGKSSGGYGALVQGIRHGDAWAAVACHSGDMAFDWLYRRDFPGTLDALARRGGDITRFVMEFEAAPKVRGADLHAMMILAMAATYDPDPTAPFGVALPVDLHTCQLDEERWATWLAHDPVVMVQEAAAQSALGALRGLFIDCGTADQYFLHYGARQLTARLRELEIDHRYEEFDDDHSSVDYRLDASLPYLYQAIAP